MVAGLTWRTERSSHLRIIQGLVGFARASGRFEDRALILIPRGRRGTDHFSGKDLIATRIENEDHGVNVNLAQRLSPRPPSHSIYTRSRRNTEKHAEKHAPRV
jgi:hypothetical protein